MALILVLEDKDSWLDSGAALRRLFLEAVAKVSLDTAAVVVAAPASSPAAVAAHSDSCKTTSGSSAVILALSLLEYVLLRFGAERIGPFDKPCVWACGNEFSVPSIFFISSVFLRFDNEE